MKRMILASGSPRRKELLRQLIGDNFEIKTSSYEEKKDSPEPIRLVLDNSLGKARDVAKEFDSGIVISADTIVSFEGEILGKPKTKENTIEMLGKINGKYHDVITGMTVIDIDNNKEIQDHEMTKVKMKKMTNEEIENYANSGEPLDKAGAYAIQGIGSVFIEKIDGCYFNVDGLPLFKLNKILEELGVSIFEYKSK